MKNRNIDGNFYEILIVILAISFSACSEKSVTISGNIDYLGDQYLILEYPPLHYKYSTVERETLNVSRDGNFDLSVNNSSDSLVYLVIQDEKYPLFLSDKDLLEININRSQFPEGVTVNGYDGPYPEQYSSYLSSVEGIDEQIDAETEKMKTGESNRVLELARNKVGSAKEYLTDTPFAYISDRVYGEYLVYRIREVEYMQDNFKNFDADSARQEVLNEAEKNKFFTLNSLKSQRAGIRDFAHYYSRTFGIYDSVLTAYDQELSEYDIKRLAYPSLNAKKLQLLPLMEDRDALAYAKLFYIAERIGEQSLERADESYQQYLEEFSSYRRYTEFLRDFYQRMENVSPGNPAIPFGIPDRDGEIVTMEDQAGKYVLLDFWAGWCQPCLNEFPEMRRLYQKYPGSRFEILGISTEIDSLVWIQDIERFENPWPQLYGGNGFDQSTFKAYQGGGIPFYILVDPEGNILRYNDIRPTFNLETILDSLIITE